MCWILSFQISSRRLRLLLVFSVERNWCAVVQKLLDILFEVNNLEAAFTKLSDVLHEEVSLLHRAVQRKCRPMVELLLGYVPSSLAHANESEFGLFQRKLQFKSHWASIFRPDVNGPAGLTPLHIAANMQDSEEVVDALTSDPCQVSLVDYGVLVLLVLSFLKTLFCLVHSIVHMFALFFGISCDS